MLKKIGKKLINNFSLKIIAALSAIILWIVVVNIDDPIKTLPYTTSVTLLHTDYITSQDKYFEVLNANNTVSFTVSAKRSVLERIVNTDFSATADMEKIAYDEKSGGYRVPISVSSTKYSSSQVTISVKESYMEISLEDLGRTQKKITADVKGTVADGCAVGDVSVVGSNLLKISGPYSIVSQIDTAKGTVNVEGMSSDVTDSVVPVLYDAQGNVVDTTKLTLSMNTVTIEAQILNTKDVAVELKTSGNVADGYIMTGLHFVPDTVRLKGEAADLNPINKITIPAEVLDLTEAASNIDTTIDISAYLPDRVSLVLNSDAIVNVVVDIEPVAKRTFEIPVSQLTVKNLNPEHSVHYGVEFMSVEVAGPQSVMQSMTVDKLAGSIDVGGVSVGEHSITVLFEIAVEGVQQTAEVRVPVIISDGSMPDHEPGDLPQTGDVGTGATQIPDSTQKPERDSQKPENSQKPERDSEKPENSQKPERNSQKPENSEKDTES